MAEGFEPAAQVMDAEQLNVSDGPPHARPVSQEDAMRHGRKYRSYLPESLQCPTLLLCARYGFEYLQKNTSSEPSKDHNEGPHADHNLLGPYMLYRPSTYRRRQYPAQHER